MINLWLMACILFLYPVWRFMMMMMMMMTIFVHIASSHSDVVTVYLTNKETYIHYM